MLQGVSQQHAEVVVARGNLTTSLSFFSNYQLMALAVCAIKDMDPILSECVVAFCATEKLCRRFIASPSLNLQIYDNVCLF